MNITEFLQLAPGNEIQQGAHAYRVIHNHAGVVVAQRTIKLSTGDDWSFVPVIPPALDLTPRAPAKPKTGDFPPAPKRPPKFFMHQQFLDSGGLAIESKDGTKYRIRGRVFDTLEAAWDALPKVKFEGGATLQSMREELFKIGWTMNTPSDGAEVTWTSPGSRVIKSIQGTRAAWEYVFGDDAP